MRTVGLLGGMSWESSAVYYRILNELAKTHLGPTHSCPLVMHSFDFEPLRQLSFDEDWDSIAQTLAGPAKKLERAGADCLLICANTMHRVAPQVQAQLQIPLISLIHAVGKIAAEMGVESVGVLGTKFTMQGKFYLDGLAEHGLKVLTPRLASQDEVHRVIYDELIQGALRDGTRESLKAIIGELEDAGAEAIVLGCTELPMILSATDANVPLLDTTRIHCEAAIAFVCSD